MTSEENDGRVKLHQRHPSEMTHIVMEEVTNDVSLVVTQLYCHNGHNLIGLSDEEFNGFPGISLWVESNLDEPGEVIVSPIHGDSEKRGALFTAGAQVAIKCPVCKEELPALTNCNCSEHGTLRKLYLTPKLSDAYLVAVCDMWGCPLSRVIDSCEMFSEFLDGNIGGE